MYWQGGEKLNVETPQYSIIAFFYGEKDCSRAGQRHIVQSFLSVNKQRRSRESSGTSWKYGAAVKKSEKC